MASLGWIACYDIANGNLVWKNKLEGQRYGKMSLAITADGNLISGGAGFLSLIDPSSGQTLVAHNLKGTGFVLFFCSKISPFNCTIIKVSQCCSLRSRRLGLCSHMGSSDMPFYKKFEPALAE